jgi:hypothetical protein
MARNNESFRKELADELMPFVLDDDVLMEMQDGLMFLAASVSSCSLGNGLVAHSMNELVNVRKRFLVFCEICALCVVL